MDTKSIIVLTIVYLSIVSAGRVIPLSIEEKSVNVFDNSKYGLLQLNNGLAQTPQMG